MEVRPPSRQRTLRNNAPMQMMYRNHSISDTTAMSQALTISQSHKGISESWKQTVQSTMEKTSIFQIIPTKVNE